MQIHSFRCRHAHTVHVPLCLVKSYRQHGSHTWYKYNPKDWNPIKDLLNTESKLRYLCLSEKTASEENPTDSWGTLSRIQVRCFFLFSYLLFFESVLPCLKGIMLILFSLTDSGCCVMMDKVLQSKSMLTLDEIKYVRLGLPSVHSLQYGLRIQEIWEYDFSHTRF